MKALIKNLNQPPASANGSNCKPRDRHRGVRRKKTFFFLFGGQEADSGRMSSGAGNEMDQLVDQILTLARQTLGV